MKPKVYIETSIPSYLTARKSRDLIVAANQALTQEWLDNRKQHLLNVLQEVEELAMLLIAGNAIPITSKTDALHIAIATVYGMNYLLTWICKHIANAAQQSIIYSICKSAGFKSPIICTPLQLIGD